jgi:predicted  nucleic acid-binding Zn-ribbon protein
LRRKDPGRPITSITDFSDLGPAIGEIKRNTELLTLAVDDVSETVDDVKVEVVLLKNQMSEVRPGVQEVRDGFINLKARTRVSEARLKKLESEPKGAHDCHQTAIIGDLSEGHKQSQKALSDTSQKVAINENEISGLSEQMKERKQGGKWVRNTFITIGLAVLAVAAGWVVTLATLRADVRHLSTEQTRMRTEVEKARDLSIKATAKVNAAAKRVETAAEVVENNGHAKTDPWLEDFCRRVEKMQPWQKRRMLRDYGFDRLPCGGSL